MKGYTREQAVEMGKLMIAWGMTDTKLQALREDGWKDCDQFLNFSLPPEMYRLVQGPSHGQGQD